LCEAASTHYLLGKHIHAPLSASRRTDADASSRQAPPHPPARRPPPDTGAFTTTDEGNPFRSFYQPINDLTYKVKIVDAGSSQEIASYTVTVFGVGGLAFGPVANLGRHLSPQAWGTTPFAKAKAAVAAEARKGVAVRNSALPSWATQGVAAALGAFSGSAEDAQGPESASPMFPQAPTMPAQWGQ
jgi:hypothetical protein